MQTGAVPRLFSGCIPASALLQNSTYLPVPRLAILQHKAYAEETVPKNGYQKTVHTILKNSPYQLQIGTTAGLPKVDFTKIAFEAFLLYDCAELKEVDYVKVKPMDFKAIPLDNGQLLNVELRIKVLTSQHEDMLYKVKIQGYNPVTREELTSMVVLTPSIRVISKPEQLKTKKEKIEPKKRTPTDPLSATLARIEQTQDEQQELLEQMIDFQSKQIFKRQKKSNQESSILWEVLPSKSMKLKEDKNRLRRDYKSRLLILAAANFEEAFIDLVLAFGALTAEEKPDALRKILRNTSIREIERLGEIVDLVYRDMQNQPAPEAKGGQYSPQVPTHFLLLMAVLVWIALINRSWSGSMSFIRSSSLLVFYLLPCRVTNVL